MTGRVSSWAPRAKYKRSWMRIRSTRSRECVRKSGVYVALIESMYEVPLVMTVVPTLRLHCVLLVEQGSVTGTTLAAERSRAIFTPSQLN